MSAIEASPSVRSTIIWRATSLIRQRPALALSILCLALVALVALGAPLLPYGPFKQDILHRNGVPSAFIGSARMNLAAMWGRGLPWARAFRSSSQFPRA